MIPVETAPSLSRDARLMHGFFGRQGGWSTGDFASLNMSEGSGDDLSLVARNRAEAIAELGASPAALATVRQTHSSLVRTLTEPVGVADRPEADAMVTNVPGLVLGILTADCTPILLAAPEAGVVGAVHAGWKGAIGGILANAVRAMRALGAEPGGIVAALGPTISAANYEVGDDFETAFLKQYPGGRRHFSRSTGGRPHFDLPGFVAAQLRDAGVTAIEQVARCTYAEPDRYFSHRFATHRGTRTGRQMAAIGLR